VLRRRPEQRRLAHLLSDLAQGVVHDTLVLELETGEVVPTEVLEQAQHVDVTELRDELGLAGVVPDCLGVGRPEPGELELVTAGVTTL
jgi:hypothetical protein